MAFQFPGFQRRLHLDYETYSEVDIKSAGAHVYAAHPSTQALMLAWAVDDSPVQLWQPHKEAMPFELLISLTDPDTAKVAFNATFERLITKYILDIDIPAEQWRCTMVASYYLGFTGGLDDVLSQSPLNVAKDPRGRRLIQIFSKPTPANYKVRRYTEAEKPSEWLEFCGYCCQDVEVERQLLLWLAKFPMMHDWDWGRYALDQRINDRGIFIDYTMAQGALEMWEREKVILLDQLKELTGLPKVTRGPFCEWLAGQGVSTATMGKEDLSPLLKSEETSTLVKEAVKLWIEKEGKAVTKYSAMLKGVGADCRARGMFQFKGASRTDRTAGRRIQLQNLRRSFAGPQGIDPLVRAVRTGDPALLRMVTGMPVSEALGGVVRHALQAPGGRTLVVYDLSSIESVVLGWLTYCMSVDQTFREGKDTYKMFAVEYYGVQYDEVTKAQRGFSKPPVLGCGYMLGWRGLIAYAYGMGVTMDEDSAKRAVNTFRTMYPEIPAFWNWIYEAVKYTILTGQPCTGYRLTIERDADFLRIWLPSGRALSYYQPQVKRRPAHWADIIPTEKANGCTLPQLRKYFPEHDDVWLEANGYITVGQWVDNVSYMGTNLDTNQWTRVYAHAGLFTENIVQSMAMDILFDGIQRAEDEGIEVVIQVHDELGAEADCHKAEETAIKLKQCMATPPTWAPDMWLGASGYISNYYMKD